MKSSATLVHATGDSTGGRAHICRGDNTAEQIVNVPVPQILEKNVEVIKVILQEQCQHMRVFLLRACGKGELWAAQLRTWDSLLSHVLQKLGFEGRERYRDR